MSSYAERPAERDSKADEDPVAARVRRGLRVAGAAYAGDKATAVEGLLDATDLPALGDDEPLAALSRRLDAEADLWRNLALRALARVERAGRLVTAVALGAVVFDAGLAAIAALGAFLGFADAQGRALLLGTGALISTLALASIAAAASLSRRAQREVARLALARADLAELRLHRIAVVLAIKSADAGRYGEALARLERDASG